MLLNPKYKKYMGPVKTTDSHMHVLTHIDVADSDLMNKLRNCFIMSLQIITLLLSFDFPKSLL